MLLTLKFKVEIEKNVTNGKVSEVKTYVLTRDYEDTLSIKSIIDSATEDIRTMVNSEAPTAKVSCVSIMPSIETTVVKIEEPVVNETTESFETAMNKPENVVEEIPEDLKKEEVEESPFSNTYYEAPAEVVPDKIEEPDVPEINDGITPEYEAMVSEKFFNLPFLTRQNLLIKDFQLLPQEHRGDRHKVAYPIAIEEAKKKGMLKEFYAAIESK